MPVPRDTTVTTPSTRRARPGPCRLVRTSDSETGTSNRNLSSLRTVYDKSPQRRDKTTEVPGSRPLPCFISKSANFEPFTTQSQSRDRDVLTVGHQKGGRPTLGVRNGSTYNCRNLRAPVIPMNVQKGSPKVGILRVQTPVHNRGRVRM